MIKSLIFDLSEVLISGIVGVEGQLSNIIKQPQSVILNSFGGPNLEKLCLGSISEEQYLENLIETYNWTVSKQIIKSHLRDNFKNEVDGMIDLLSVLNKNYDLILLSDHCKEWIDFIENFHNFFHLFKKKYYSFLSRSLKTESLTFQNILSENSLIPKEVLFIDDNLRNIKTAQNEGIKGIGFTDYIQCKQIMEKTYKLALT